MSSRKRFQSDLKRLIRVMFRGLAPGFLMMVLGVTAPLHAESPSPMPMGAEKAVSKEKRSAPWRSLALGASQRTGARDGAAPIRCLLEAVHQAVLSSELPARIEKLPLREGDRFKKGALLVQFDCASYRAQLRLARAELKGGLKTLNNSQKLAKLRSVGSLEVELAAVEVEKARAHVQSAQVLVNKCQIKAPFVGRIASRQVNRYERVQEGKPLLEVLDDTLLEIHMVAPSKWLTWLKVGAPFSVLVDETGERHEAKVVKLGARIDPVSQSIKVTGRFVKHPDDLLSGMSGQARFQRPPGLSNGVKDDVLTPAVIPTTPQAP